MAKTYYCGLCDEKMKTDLSTDEEELREHYFKEHKQVNKKKTPDGKEIEVQTEPSGMQMYVGGDE